MNKKELCDKKNENTGKDNEVFVRNILCRNLLYCRKLEYQFEKLSSSAISFMLQIGIIFINEKKSWLLGQL